MTPPDLVIYHGNCADGFAAAWALRYFMGEHNVEYFAGTYNEPPPDVTDRFVTLVDFSYPRAVIEEMLKKATHITILDHHKSAHLDLIGLTAPNFNPIFDMERSGAQMAFDYASAGLGKRPTLIDHIGDRDLWKFKLPRTKEIAAAVFSYPYDFKVWDTLMVMPIDDLADEGSHILRKHRLDVEGILKSSTRPMNISGHVIAAANAPYMFASDVANSLAKGAAFGVAYHDTSTHRVFSLRSDEAGEDVSIIAGQYGGGGHQHAAGFRIPLKDASRFDL